MNVTTDSENDIVEAACVRLNAKAADAASITPVIERRSLSRRTDEVVVAIEAACVNPSDVKAATGLMPYAVFPRTPGRDFSGVVVPGPRKAVPGRHCDSQQTLGMNELLALTERRDSGMFARLFFGRSLCGFTSPRLRGEVGA
jgi:hypothetical protein